ncbi:protein prune homolog 2 isoform X2 [Chironomus tepperi]|uniref:protein prune homolog 2 isoform X2 n=1 Tax=Chironomus tepperi TaxID=113505 RepID=UPI00391F52A1
MDNQANSPDYQQMDVSENCTTDTSSISPTNQTDNELNIVKSSENNVEKISSSFNSLNLNVTMSKKQDDNENRNTLSLSSSSNDQQMKLTPVRHHPLEFFDDNDSEDSSSFSNSNNRNFPDVVLMTHNSNNQPSSHHLTTTSHTKTTKTSSMSNDLVNCVNNNDERCQRIKYREPSPDIYDFKSDSEPDVSQYQAEVCPSFNKVTLVNTNSGQQQSPSLIRLQQSSSSPKFLHLDIESNSKRRVPLSDSLKVDQADDSSPEESSYRNDDFFDDFDDDALHMNSTDYKSQTNAVEESRNVRNFQCITLPDGKSREIDMKVIEPYKRILSHGGYLKAGGHNAIVVFSACHLPDRSRKDYNYVMNNLFYYVIKTLEQLVTDDYVLVYLHGASNRKNSPPFPWLKKCYQLLDRRLRKSLKSCYIVHPTFWLKSLIWMTRPFISAKFWRKLVYVPSLEELYTLVPLERNSIPDKVLTFNARHSSSVSGHSASNS